MLRSASPERARKCRAIRPASAASASVQRTPRTVGALARLDEPGGGVRSAVEGCGVGVRWRAGHLASRRHGGTPDRRHPGASHRRPRRGPGDTIDTGPQRLRRYAVALAHARLTVLTDQLLHSAAHPVHSPDRGRAEHGKPRRARSVVAHTDSPKSGLSLLYGLPAERLRFQPYHATRADLLARLGRRAEAVAAFAEAAALSDAPTPAPSSNKAPPR